MEHMCTKCYSHILIMGDFNFKNIDWENMTTQVGEQQPEFQFIEKIKDLFLFQHVKEATRYRVGQEPSLLDLIFTNEEDMIQELSYNPGLGKSDHICIKFNFTCIKDIYPVNKLKFDFNRADYTTINDEFTNIDWAVVDSLGIQTSWKIFVKNFTNIIEKNIPKKISKPSQRLPYIDSDTATAIREKRTTWIKNKHNKNHYTYNKYKIARNNVVSKLKKSKI